MERLRAWRTGRHEACPQDVRQHATVVWLDLDQVRLASTEAHLALNLLGSGRAPPSRRAAQARGSVHRRSSGSPQPTCETRESGKANAQRRGRRQREPAGRAALPCFCVAAQHTNSFDSNREFTR